MSEVILPASSSAATATDKAIDKTIDKATDTAAYTVTKGTASHSVIGRRMPLPIEWERFLGYMYSDTRYLIKGPEGTRKSTFVMKCSAMCGRMGKVLYVLAEEKLASGTVQRRERLARVMMHNVDYLETPTFEQVRRALDSGDYKFVVIDSVNMLEDKDRKSSDGKRDPVTQDDIMKLWEDYRIVFFYVMQMKKDYKEYRGGSAIRHYVDVIIETEQRGGAYYATAPGKHRFRHDKPLMEILI